ncbi:hypothetical protein B484DRAFT_403673 [Ochromonadaceae sp. CCMP2298]|nr:hypothetical protein B484DRAFT_403673 [Ochromonadaceae sp. CCMP2298]
MPVPWHMTEQQALDISVYILGYQAISPEVIRKKQEALATLAPKAELLEGAQAATQARFYLLAAAQALIRLGKAQYGEDRPVRRSKNQMVNMVDDLCDGGRPSAAMTAIERFAVEEASDGPTTVILDDLHPHATAADSLPSARVGPVLAIPDLKDFEYVVRQLRTSA